MIRLPMFVRALFHQLLFFFLFFPNGFLAQISKEHSRHNYFAQLDPSIPNSSFTSIGFSTNQLHPNTGGYASKTYSYNNESDREEDEGKERILNIGKSLCGPNSKEINVGILCNGPGTGRVQGRKLLSLSSCNYEPFSTMIYVEVQDYQCLCETVKNDVTVEDICKALKKKYKRGDSRTYVLKYRGSVLRSSKKLSYYSIKNEDHLEFRRK
ncbi:uncharacterized protein LOC122063422 [Macadamia integrifolia]|uniref:uncharacterized protein LOC122063422 n=1 Tax=Macadamia integrifolia TaxID=60698 RepID=UPI001C50117A|nr:uncharacterized protein LOC122063422 [Macadamia integrifolia]